MLSGSTSLRDKLESSTRYFREKMSAAGFDIKEGTHPIVPVMLYDAPLAQEFASRLLDEGIYVIGFFFPVVPKGEARIRVQISAAHEKHHLDQAIFLCSSSHARCEEAQMPRREGFWGMEPHSLHFSYISLGD